MKIVAPRNSGEVVFDGAYWMSDIKSVNAYSVTFYHSPLDGPWHDLAQVVLLHVKGDNEILIAKWMVGIPLSEEEEQQINQLFE